VPRRSICVPAPCLKRALSMWRMGLEGRRLNPEAEYSLTVAATTIGASLNAVHYEAGKLSASGLISTRRRGNLRSRTGRSRPHGERSFAEEFGVAYTTLRRAMALLRERGIIVTVHGRGTHGIPVASAAQVTLIARSGGRPAVGGVITKDLYTYSIKILRQEKNPSRSWPRSGANVIGVHSDKGDMRALARCCATAAAGVESALKHRADRQSAGKCRVRRRPTRCARHPGRST
jgi:DNA-binding transcriptional MocR family regulator